MSMPGNLVPCMIVTSGTSTVRRIILSTKPEGGFTMKHILVAALFLCITAAHAQDKAADTKKAKETVLQGYVVDQMCAKSMAKKSNPMNRAAKHTKECALEEACAASGYGLFYGDGKWVKFDEKGDKLALEMFEKSKKGNDFKAEVTGEMKGDVLVVASLKESKSATDDAKKPAKKVEEHEHQH